MEDIPKLLVCLRRASHFHQSISSPVCFSGGPRDVFVCGIAQFAILWGGSIGYTITAATGIMSFKRSNCYHENGPNAECSSSGNWFMIIFGGVEIVLSQLPNLGKVTFLSVMAALMAFGYSFIGLYLSSIKLASNHEIRGSLSRVKAGIMGVSMSQRVWHALQALGNIAFAYTYAMLLVEIQDTLKSPPPENKTMKRATMYGIIITTMFYVPLGCVGYAAFGNATPGNVLTGFREPFWLVDIANLALVMHLIGVYQLLVQPMNAFLERWLGSKWPTAGFFHTVYTIRLPFGSRSFQFTVSKLILRTVFVVITTTVAMMLPFFNAILGLLGSIAFWPLTVYFPVSMYMAQEKIKRGTRKWVVLQSLSMFALMVSLVAAVGSVADIAERLKHARLFSITL